MPSVRTIIEIGGQDSKIIFVKDKLDGLAMNTAAGTAFWTGRHPVDIPIEDFGGYALKSKTL